MKTNRNPPSIDDINEAHSLVPGVTDDNLTQALVAAGSDLPLDSRTELLVGVQQAFSEYFRNRVWRALCKRATASAVAKELKEIARKAERLLLSFDVHEKGARQRPTYLGIRREGGRYAEKRGPYRNLPLRTFSRVRFKDRTVLPDGTDYRGDERVLQIIEGVELLQELAEAAYEYERSKVEKAQKALKEAGKSTHAQRGRDEPLVRLIGNLNGCWMDCFEELPSATRSGKGEEIGGPYIKFLMSLFKSLHERTPSEVNRYAPGLRASLYRTPELLYHVIRKTKLPKLRGIARSRLDQI